MGEIATTLSRLAARTASTPASARIGPIETSGFDGATTTATLSTERARGPDADSLARSAPSKRTAVDGHAVLALHEVLLERHLDALGGQRHDGGDPIVAHRHQAAAAGRTLVQISAVTSVSVAPSASRAVR